MRVAVVTALLTAGIVHAQAPQQPAFDVVSIRPTNNDTRGRNPGVARPGGRWAAMNTTVSLLLSIAYPDFRFPGLIVGGPGWISERTFDIDAQAPTPNPSVNEYALMLRQLLADRFSLKVRFAQRPVDVYVLVVARGDGRLGPGLIPASAACVAEYTSGRLKPQVVPPLQIEDRAPRPCMATTHENGNRRRTFGTWSFDATLGMLQLVVDRKVVDRTGLNGFYDIDLEYDPRSTRPPDGASDLGVSIFTAVQEQLGLRLERRREMLDVLVIDSVKMPSEN